MIGGFVCFYPQEGFKSTTPTVNGKYQFVYKGDRRYDEPMVIACGSCSECRLKRTKDWAIRCEHEMSMHDKNCFITLTYSDEFLPKDMSLNHDHFRDFMKRFRRRISDPDDQFFDPDFSEKLPLLPSNSHPDPGVKYRKTLRYYMCGEYGDLNLRPHFHAIIFGYNFPDLKVFKRRNQLKISQFLTELWPFGFSTVGEANYVTAAYVARYVMKKVTGLGSDAHYAGRKPEYAVMSRRQGIARKWIEKYYSDVYNFDYVVTRKGAKQLPPKYYDSFMKGLDPDRFDEISHERYEKMMFRRLKFPVEFTYERLRVKEKVLLSKISVLKRDLSEGEIP